MSNSVPWHNSWSEIIFDWLEKCEIKLKLIKIILCSVAKAELKSWKVARFCYRVFARVRVWDAGRNIRWSLLEITGRPCGVVPLRLCNWKTLWWHWDSINYRKERKWVTSEFGFTECNERASLFQETVGKMNKRTNITTRSWCQVWMYCGHD